MNTIKLKNIVISILVLLNACLLFLLLSRNSTARQDYERTVAQLVALYDSGEVTLNAESIPRGISLPEAQPQRDVSVEERFAKTLLGEELAIDSGGGIYHYRSESGSCTFRGSGSVEALLARTVEDPAAFCRELGESFGYTEFSSTLDAQGGTVSAMRTLGGAPVYGCTLTFRFRENTLTSVSGAFLASPTLSENHSESDPITALVRFFDYRSASGVVCTEIRDIRCGYLLDSISTGTQRLVQAIRIDTDVYSYCVIGQSGEVLRIS